MKLTTTDPSYLRLNTSPANVSEGERITPNKLEEIQKTLTESRKSFADDLPVSSTSVIVELSVEPETPSYVQQEGVVRYTPEGRLELEGRVEALALELDESSRGGTFSPSSILSHLTELDVSNGSYYDASRFYSGRVRTDETGQPINPDFHSFSKSHTTASFSLDIETRDGDKVTINISAEQGGDFFNMNFSGTSFSLEVDGELDEDELEAIQRLAVELSDASSAYYSGRGMAQLNGLQSFDQEELVGFDLALENGAKINAASFHFEIDQQNGEQTLEASQKGLKYTITVDRDNQLVDEDLQNNAQFQAYLKIIDKASNAYNAAGISSQDIAAFFKDGFTTAFRANSQSSAENTETKPASIVINPQQRAVAQSTMSGLADFQADFFGTGIDGVNPNPQRLSEASFMALKMEQETITRSGQALSGEYVEVEQRSQYEMDVRQHKPLPGLDSIDFEHKNYRYETLKEQETLVRSINMDNNGSLNSGSVAHTHEKTETEKEYREGKLEKDNINKEQQAVLLDSSDLEVLQKDKVNRQLGLYTIIDSISEDYHR